MRVYSSHRVLTGFYQAVGRERGRARGETEVGGEGTAENHGQCER